jgi:hypothetical protein
VDHEPPLATSIQIEQLKHGEYRVRVIEGSSETSHVVTLQPADHQRLADGKAQPEELLRRSFEFLLEREPKESILTRFDLPLIARYFPEYEREIRRRIEATDGNRSAK